MPSSAVRLFADPDAYAASLRATSLELVLSQRGVFSGRIVRVDLHDMWLQRFSENLPQIGHSAIIPGRAVISLYTREGPDQFWNGRPTNPAEIIQHSEAEEFYRRSAGRSDRMAMSLPLGVANSILPATSGTSLGAPHTARVLTPPPAATARLRRLHAQVCRLAEEAPEIIANTEVARGLEQMLLEAWAACLPDDDGGEDNAARGRHSLIMRRFRRVLMENPDRALYIPELCQAIGVPERTFRMCCVEQLGMSPKRYLLLRRLHLARRALQAATPTSSTVTNIATLYGFWEFGRFAAVYRSMFDELPSETLQRDPDGRRPVLGGQ